MTEDRNTQISNSSPEAELTLSVRNFGPISSGQIDLRPLTVFAGPSDVGKSWMATLIYVLEKNLRETNNIYWPSSASSHKTEFRFPMNPQKWINSIKETGLFELTNKEKEYIEGLYESNNDSIKSDMVRCFGAQKPSHLVREGRAKKANIVATIKGKKQGIFSRHSINITKLDEQSLIVKILEKPLYIRSDDEFTRIIDRVVLAKSRKDESDEGDITLVGGYDFSVFQLLEKITSYIFGDREQSSFYLPADRGGIMHAHSVVVSTLIQNASRAGLAMTPSLPVLSGVLTDFLQGLIDMASSGQIVRGVFPPRWIPPEQGDLSKRIEEHILQGEVIIDTSNVNYPRFSIRPKEWDRGLPLMNASSMISELAPVVLYLRHLVRPADLLILEEPEAHLHPSMQVQFVQEIATCVQRGIRVLLTTHSEWVLDELANVIARGETTSTRVRKGPALSKEQVGLWLFDHKNQKRKSFGSHIREVRWDPEEGGFDVEYDRVAMKLHNVWVNLMGDSE